MVRVERVSKVFDDLRAVDDVSFALRRGAFLTILGPSGCGKTTLLRMIAGFIQPDEGEVFIHGKAVSAVPPHRRSIGMVFQKLALFPHMTAAQNVAYPLKMRRFDARRIPDLVARYLALVRLEDLGGRRIHELSGGQQQRVAIARALVFQPDLLLLDEPLAALDRKLREDMQLEFRRIQQELGVTTINVTHDQREALVMSDEILVMEGGRQQQLADPFRAYRAPANPFVAGFIGVTNFLPGVIASANGEAVALTVSGCELTGRCVGGSAEVGLHADGALRAEQIRIYADEAGLAALDTRLSGTVAEVIFEGDRLVYTIALPALGGLALRVFDHDPLNHAAHPTGAAVHVGWNSRDLLVFPH